MFNFRCETLKYVQAFFACELPVASTELLFEVPSLRVMLRKQSDFAFLRALRGLEIARFHEISLSDTHRGAHMRNLDLAWDFSLVHVWS